ncbi:MAG: (d)CMP kinase [Chitinispirillaceae bacterium]|nr:(d)CMP kinase [Chitinispirillaceae bacterium]
MIIAIDGPAGSGKSSTAKAVARRLNITYLDTGAMYRVITLAALREGVAPSDEGALDELVGRTAISFTGVPPATRVLMNGEDVSEEIRGEAVTAKVSEYCAPAVVRRALVDQQRRMGRGRSLVCEGRDIGTTVFPDAGFKIFMTASVAERAERRRKDFARLGIEKSIDELAAELVDRDRKDSGRAVSPFVKADDAVDLDTSGMTFDEQVDWIVEHARKRGFIPAEESYPGEKRRITVT